ncbi:hypothetical protein PCC7418_0949 [Halothece sp. PCC 7418]|nr:hypothetical protein [Halothece sp. PCC 7418]AFZ43158.1 hypothetical protein PCC7418_0949 [Halothece sp. PCC 7418]
MLEQFRTHFPQGSLISELIQIDHGKYIVRASVQNEGLTLATGLAAADTVEQAEDKARDRALAVLNLSLSPSSSPSVVTSTPEQAEKTVASSPQKDFDTPTTQTFISQASEVSFTENQSPSSQGSPTAVNGVSHTEERSSLSSSESSELVQDLNTDVETERNDPEVSSRKIASTETEAGASASSRAEELIMDSSDIIARTNVELRRLNWTSEQGRKFLEETYGKRSRSLLSESELLEFLQYLEKQPTPTAHGDQ